MTRFEPIQDIDGYGLMAYPLEVTALIAIGGVGWTERRLLRKGYRTYVISRSGWKLASRATVWVIRDRLEAKRVQEPQPEETSA